MDRPDPVVGVRVPGKQRAAGRIERREPASGLSICGGEPATRIDDPTFHSHGQGGAVQGPRPREHRARRLTDGGDVAAALAPDYREVSGHVEDACMLGHAPHRRVRIRIPRLDRAGRGVHLREAGCGLTADGRELSTQIGEPRSGNDAEDLAIHRGSKGLDGGRLVVERGRALTQLPTHHGEVPADVHTGRPEGDCPHRRVGRHVGIPGSHRAGDRVHRGEVVSCGAPEGLEVPAHVEDPGAERERADAQAAGARIEDGIHGSTRRMRASPFRGSPPTWVNPPPMYTAPPASETTASTLPFTCGH